MDASAFVDAAPYSSSKATDPIKPTKDDIDAQLHVLMPKSDILALKRAALERGTTVSNLVRESVRMYIVT
jgi:hypothetical protein